MSKLTHLLLAAEGGGGGGARAQITELVGAQRWAIQSLLRNDAHSMMRVSVDLKRGQAAPQALAHAQARRSGEAAARQLVRATHTASTTHSSN